MEESKEEEEKINKYEYKMMRKNIIIKLFECKKVRMNEEIKKVK